MNAPHKIIKGLKDAVAGNLSAVTIEGRRWIRAPEWQPIETAPKDGTFFLARYRLVSDEEDEHGRVIKRNVVEHFTVVAYYVFNGFVEFPWRGSFVRNMTFTHWMPLPDAPVQP